MSLSSFASKLSIFALVGCAGAVVAGCSPCAAPQGAAAPALDAQTHVVSVLGAGEVSRKPDVARTTLGVSVAAPTVAEASRLANQQMTALLAAIKKQGILDKDIQTANYSVNFERTEPPFGPGGPVPASAPPRGHYRVANNVRVTIRDIDKAGALLDAAVAAGASEVWGLSFEIDEPAPFEAEAREKAVKDAHARAKALAETQGLGLGEVVSISALPGAGLRPMFSAKAADAAGYEDGAPVAPGEVTVAAHVEVVYRLAPAGANK